MLKIPTSFTKVSQVLDTACTAQMLCLQFVPLTSASSILPGSLHPGKSVSLPSRIFALVTLSVEKGLLQDTLLNDVDDLTCKAEIETWTQRRNKWIATGKKGSGKNWATEIDIYSLLILHIRQPMWTYCIEQGTQFNALWWPTWEGNPKQRCVRVYIYNSFAIQQKVTQHCKAIVGQSLSHVWFFVTPWTVKQLCTKKN